MAVIIVEPVEAGAAWLAHALAGLDQRILRTASPDEAMGAIATEGREVLAALVGSGLDDEQALGLASRLQQAAPEVAVVLLRQRESGQMLRAAALARSSRCSAPRAAVARPSWPPTWPSPWPPGGPRSPWSTSTCTSATSRSCCSCSRPAPSRTRLASVGWTPPRSAPT